LDIFKWFRPEQEVEVTVVSSQPLYRSGFFRDIDSKFCAATRLTIEHNQRLYVRDMFDLSYGFPRGQKFFTKLSKWQQI